MSENKGREATPKKMETGTKEVKKLTESNKPSRGQDPGPRHSEKSK